MTEPIRMGGAVLVKDVFAEILTIQRHYRDRIAKELPGPEPAEMPKSYILESETFPFSPQIFREICLRLAPLLAKDNPQLDFVPLLSRLDDEVLDSLAQALQCSPEQDLVQALDQTIKEVRVYRLSNLDREGLHMLLLAAFVPFYTAYASHFGAMHDNWQRGWCPVCGQYPVNGYNRPGDGRRVLGCWMCETQWTHARLQCTVCSASFQEEVKYLVPTGGDRTRRIQVCEECGHYLKISDYTQASADCDLAVENAATVQLDILAQRRGYRPASRPLRPSQ